MFQLLMHAGISLLWQATAVW